MSLEHYVFAQLARVGRLGRWVDVDDLRTELDLGELYVCVCDRNWLVYASASGRNRFQFSDYGIAPNKEEAKLASVVAASTRCNNMLSRVTSTVGPVGRDRERFRHGLKTRYDASRDLIDIAMVRLDAEMEGRPLP